MSHALVKLLGGEAPWLMGVINATPDSFSDGGLLTTPEVAVARARQLAADGAAIVDIGGEATGPHATPVDAATELLRIEPIVAALAGEMVLSIDTYHARTAARCLELGARVINDVSAARAEPEIADVVKEHRAILVMMHAKDGPLPHPTDTPARYGDVARDIADWLVRRVDWALGRGLKLDQLVLDPGMGQFVSLDPVDSWRLLANLVAVVDRVAPVPVLIGVSRKGFLDVPLEERDALSQLVATVAAYRGAAVIRTHDVKMAGQFLTGWRRLGLALPARDRLRIAEGREVGG